MKITSYISTCAAFLVVIIGGLFFATTAQAQYDIAGDTTVLGEPNTPFVFGDIEITGTGAEPIPVKLLVTDGTLEMSLTTGLDFDGPETGSVLYFNGSLEDVNNALATLTYTRADEGTDTLEISLVNPGEVFFPGNGHLYEYVSSTLTWTAAEAAAEGLTRYGATGYLTTITSQEENDFVAERLENAGWMGASDSVQEGDWQWVTGPETGVSFWSGDEITGVAVDDMYENWNEGEPNDSGSNEHCAQFLAGGSGFWNDLPCTVTTLPGYVVEFGADGDMPQVAAREIDITIEIPPTPQELALAKILEYSDSEGMTDEPTVEDYETAGVDGVTENSVLAINTVIAEGGVDDLGDIQNIVDTIELLPPTVVTTPVTGVDRTSVTLTGTITSAGTNFVTGQGFEYGKTTSYGSVVASDHEGVFDIGPYELLLQDLRCGATYHYRAFAENSEGVSYGADEEFTTSDCPSSGGSSVSSRVMNLLKTGNTEQAEKLIQQYPSAFPNQSVISASTLDATLGESGVCSVDTLLTQNLRAPSRNGVFNSYTQGIVTEAAILQAHLNRLGFESGNVDGILGPITDSAIKRMQTYLGTKADGYVGPITRGLLNNSCGAAGL